METKQKWSLKSKHQNIWHKPSNYRPCSDLHCFNVQYSLFVIKKKNTGTNLNVNPTLTFVKYFFFFFNGEIKQKGKNGALQKTAKGLHI